MIPRQEHPDPTAAWESLGNWISLHAVMPDGDPVRPELAKVLAIGAYIGCRFALLYDPFALAIAEFGNSQENPIFVALNRAFKDGYMEWISEQMASYAHNLGFTDLPVQIIHKSEEETPSQLSPLTDDDAKSILADLDGLFGDGKELA